jgi:hypothetical protein
MSDLMQAQDAADLLSISELTGIRVYEIRGKRHEDADASPKEATPEIAIRTAGDALETRMRVSLSTNEADLFCDIGVQYTFRVPVEASKGVIGEFVERVAVMAVFPYVRESFFTTASRLGVGAPVLGLLRAGSFEIGGFEGPDRVSLAPRVFTPAELAQDMGVTAKAVREHLRRMGATPDDGGKWLIPEKVADEVRSAMA